MTRSRRSSWACASACVRTPSSRPTRPWPSGSTSSRSTWPASPAARRSTTSTAGSARSGWSWPRGEGAAARRRDRSAGARLCLLQPDHARRGPEAARGRLRLPARAGASGGHVPAHPARRDRRPPEPLLSLYDAVAELPLRVESYELERLEQPVSSGFTRVTTVIHLQGAGEEGVGEDVTYDAAQHPPPDDLPLAGEHTLDSYSAALEPHAFSDHRRWGFESAALDLALRQAGRSLADVVEREPRPVRFVVSKRFDSIEVLRKLLDRYPGTRFKLDPTSDWSDELVEQLAALAGVDTVDLKGAYHGTMVDLPPDPALYERVARAFPEAWIEDPALTDETEPVLEPYRERITWDAPIHSVADVVALPLRPRRLDGRP